MASFALTFYLLNLRLFRLDSEVKRVRLFPIPTYCDRLEAARSSHLKIHLAEMILLVAVCSSRQRSIGHHIDLSINAGTLSSTETVGVKH